MPMLLRCGGIADAVCATVEPADSRGVSVAFEEGPLLGIERRALVDRLVDRIAQLQAGEDVPRIVLLRAESGAGKTRIARELYERLRQRQPGGTDAGFWPPLPTTLAARRVVGDPMPGRKVIGPSLKDFEVHPGAYPRHTWWSVTCEQRPDGSLAQVSRDLTQQAEALQAYLKEGYEQATDEQKSKSTRVFGYLRGAGTRIGMSLALDTALGVAGISDSPMGTLASPLLDETRRTFRSREERAERKALVARGGALTDPDSLAQEIRNRLACYANADLPMVLAIEDVQLMDEDLEALLDLLAEPDADFPMLVVATGWPTGDKDSRYETWLDHCQDSPDRVEIIDLDDLEHDALVDLVRRYAPETDQETAERVVARWSNPQALQLMLTDDLVQEMHVVDGALVMSEEQASRLPDDVLEWFGQRWGRLPKTVQQSLMTAIGCLPKSARVSPATWPFVSDIVAEAADIVAEAAATVGPPSTSDVVQEALSEAEDPYEWVEQAGQEPLLVFRDWTLATVADEERHKRSRRDPRLNADGLLAATRSVLRARIEDWASEGTFDWDLYSDRGAACLWLWQLNQSGPSAELGFADAVAVAHHARLLAWSRRLSAAVEAVLHSGCLELLPRDHPDTWMLRLYAYTWLAQSGRVSESIAHLRDLVAELEANGQQRHPAALQCRLGLVERLSDVGHYDEVERLGQQLLDDASSAGEEQGQLTLDCRAHLAWAASRLGHVEDAMERFVALINDLTATLGPTHEKTLGWRANYAILLRDEGRFEDAIAILESVLEDQVLNDEISDYAMLTVRSNLLICREDAGIGDSQAEERALLTHAYEELLGPDDPATLLQRIRLAHSIGKNGQPERAVTELRAVQRAQREVLSPDHPDLRATTRFLAIWLFQCGRTDEAVDILTAAINECKADPDLPPGEALPLQEVLAFVFLASSQAGAALNAWQAVLGSQSRVYGADSPHTWSTRTRIADLLATLNRFAEAADICRELLEEQVLTEGPEAVSTTETRFRLGQYLTLQGQDESAVHHLRIVVSVFADHDSSDPRMAELAQEQLAIALFGTGDSEGAIEVYQQLHQKQLSSRGPGAQETLTTAVRLANTLIASDRPAEAVPLLEDVLMRQDGLVDWPEERLRRIEHNLEVARARSRN